MNREHIKQKIDEIVKGYCSERHENGRLVKLGKLSLYSDDILEEIFAHKVFVNSGDIFVLPMTFVHSNMSFILAQTFQNLNRNEVQVHQEIEIPIFGKFTVGNDDARHLKTKKADVAIVKRDDRITNDIGDLKFIVAAEVAYKHESLKLLFFEAAEYLTECTYIAYAICWKVYSLPNGEMRQDFYVFERDNTATNPAFARRVSELVDARIYEAPDEIASLAVETSENLKEEVTDHEIGRLLKKLHLKIVCQRRICERNRHRDIHFSLKGLFF